jgi:outer membrane protein
MKYIKYSCIAVFFAGGLFAQDLDLLTKEEAVAEALQANFGITIASNNLEIAENNKSLLNSDFLPSLTGNAGANYTVDDQNVAFQDGRVNNIMGAETTRYNASLNLAYTLFDGLGRWYDYKRLKEQYNLSELQVRETIETTLLQLFTVYYEVARIAENVTVLEETFQNTKDRLMRAEYGFEYGQNNKLEVLNAEVDMVTDRINLMDSRQQLANTKRDLNVVLNSDVERRFQVDTLVRFTESLVLDGFLIDAEKNNVRLQQAERSIMISDYSYKASKSIYLPSVGLSGSYGWNEGKFPTTSFAASSVTNGFGAGVSLGWSLFDGGRGITAVKNARIQTENDAVLMNQVISEVKRDVANAKGDYTNRLSIYDLLSKNVQTARDNYHRSSEGYKLGQITSVELRQAQINLLNAQTNKNSAKYQAKLAELQLLQLTGQLLNIAI